MRYEQDHKARTHQRILKNAARRFRAEGLNGPGVATVMKASGLTVGGFYKHFRSKDELLAEAIDDVNPTRCCTLSTGRRSDATRRRRQALAVPAMRLIFYGVCSP